MLSGGGGGGRGAKYLLGGRWGGCGGWVVCGG